GFRRSVAIRVINSVHLPNQGIEGGLTNLRLLACCFDMRLGQYLSGKPPYAADPCAGHLYVTGALQQPKPHEGFLERLPPSEQAVIAQDHYALVTDACDHSSLFFGVDRDTLEDVVGDPTVQLCSIERIVRQTLFQACHGAPSRRMGVHDAVSPLNPSMDRTMGNE